VRWQNTISWNSLGLVKAGWLVKQNGVWSVTDEGRKALELPLKDFLQVADAKYDAWHAAQNSVKQGAPPKVPNVQDLEDLRTILESAGHNVWWVNQGHTYSQELKGGYLWASQKTKAGIPVSHHTDLLKVEPGDVIVHYASSALRAVSRVGKKATIANRPGELPGEPWDKDGYILRTEYHQFNAPIRIDFIPANIRVPNAGPFALNGGVKQGYLFQLSREFVDQLAGLGHATSRPVAAAPPGTQTEEFLVGATEQSLSQARVEIQDLTGRIAANGKAAIWWSYPLSQAAQTLLTTNTYLYVYVPAPTKLLTFRYRIAEFRTQAGLQGIECPWPLFAKADEIGKTAAGPNMNMTFKTWFLVDQAKELAEPITPDSLATADGGPVEMSVLRNSFAIWHRKVPDSSVNELEPGGTGTE
jgi:hypothetical protein